MFQKTISRSISCSGIGLHSGRNVEVVFHPAPISSGIKFAIKQNEFTHFVQAHPMSVVSTCLATTLGYDNIKIWTVEHVLAAIRGLEIDNIIIEVRGNEVPIFDGSAAYFVDYLSQAGIREQHSFKKILAVKQPIIFGVNECWIKATPATGFSLNYTVKYPCSFIGTQQLEYCADRGLFVSSISRARTFCFLSDVQILQRQGLALGGSLKNAVVLDEFGVINPEGLRFSDEPIRHKVLDFIGDLGLLEHQIWAHFDVYCSGHKLNNSFLRYLIENRADYLQEIELGEQFAIKKFYLPHQNQIPAQSSVQFGVN